MNDTNPTTAQRDEFGNGFGFQFCSAGTPPYSGTGGSGPCLDYATASLVLDLDHVFPGLAHLVVFETRQHHLKFQVEAFVTVTDA